MKMQCRTDSNRKVNIIVPNVMSFLTNGDDCDCVINDMSDKEGEDEEDDNDKWGDKADNDKDTGDIEDEDNLNAVNDDQKKEDDSDLVSEQNEDEF